MVVDKNATRTIKKTTEAIDGLSKSQKRFNTRTEKGNATAGLNNAILLETSRLASDASYGFQGMANNLGQVVQLLSISAENSGGFGKALKDVGSQILGVGGIMIGVQLLISFLPQLEKLFVKLTRSVDPMNEVLEKSVELAADSRSEFDTLTGILLDASKSTDQKRIALERLNRDYPDFNANVLEDAENHEAATKAIDDYMKKLDQKAKSQAAEALKEEAYRELLENQLELETIAQENNFESYADLVKHREAIDEKQSKVQSVRKKTRIKDEADLLIAETASEESAIAKLEERIDLLDEFIILEDEDREKRGRGSKDREKYDKLEIQGFDKKIALIKEVGRIREMFANKEMGLILDNIDNSQDAIEIERKGVLARIDALKSLGLTEEEVAKARFQVNAFYNKLAAEDLERLEELSFQNRMSMLKSFADSLGSISKLIGETTEAGKIAALAEIAANTAVGYSQGLRVAQKQSLEGVAFAFPAFYASQIAAVLSNAIRAKQILKGNGSGSSARAAGGTTPSVQAPEFNVVGASETSQLGMALGRTQREQKVNLVWDDLQDFNNTADRTVEVAGI